MPSNFDPNGGQARYFFVNSGTVDVSIEHNTILCDDANKLTYHHVLTTIGSGTSDGTAAVWADHPQ